MMDYKTFRETITADMCDYLDRAMDIYNVFEIRELCPRLTNLDKACASLFLAGIFYVNNIHNIIDICGINFLKIREFFDLKGIRLDEFLCEDSRLYDKTFRYLLNILNVNFETKEKIDLKKLTPEDICVNLYNPEICGTDIIGRLYCYLNENYMFNFGPSLTMLQEVIRQKEKTTILKKPSNKNVVSEDNSFFKRHGEFLTHKDYSYNPAVAREVELKMLKLALLRISKSVLLLGKEGVGKTSLVHELAYEIKNNIAHPLLNDYEIVKINPNSLLSGTEYRGDFEKEVQRMLEEIKNYPKLILYFEEMHTIMGLGRAKGVNLDLPNTLKPYLADGRVKMIGDTTLKEFEEYIKPDRAFTRRFKIIMINEPNNEALMTIMEGTIANLENYYHISFDFNSRQKTIIWQKLINLTQEQSRIYNLPKTNPDLVIDILEDTFSIACSQYHKEVKIADLIEAITNCSDIYESHKEKITKELTNIFAEEVPDYGHKLIMFPRTRS